MSIPARLSSYLDQRGLQYEVCPHAPSHNSAQTERNAHVMRQQLAKSVLLEDDEGPLMAVVPADQMVLVGVIARMLGRKQLHLSDEAAMVRLFEGCERGALPPVGMAWGVETIVDETLESMDSVYFEGGDHEHLLRMPHDDFHRLMSSARHGHIGKLPMQ